MKLLSLLTFAFITLTGLPQTAKAMDDSNATVTPVIKAVAFHSDNCGSCKILNPKMKAAMNAINTDKLEIIKFDLTNDKTTAKSKELASSKNVENILQKFGAKTGFVVLVNSKGDIVDKVKASDTTPEIAAKLAKAIASTS